MTTLHGWRAVAALLLALVVLDLARAYLPGVAALQWAAGLALLAALVPALGRSRPWREAAPVLALVAVLLPLYVDHPRALESDGIHYYTWLRSPLFDRDLDLANDYALLGSGYRGPNVLPVGASLLWGTLVLPVHALRLAA